MLPGTQMPEHPVNAPITPGEAVAAVNRKVQRYVAEGVCDRCAILLTANRYGVEFDRVRQIVKRAQDCDDG